MYIFQFLALLCGVLVAGSLTTLIADARKNRLSKIQFILGGIGLMMVFSSWLLLALLVFMPSFVLERGELYEIGALILGTVVGLIGSLIGMCSNKGARRAIGASGLSCVILWVVVFYYG